MINDQLSLIIVHCYRQPIFPLPLCRFTPPVKLDLRRCSGALRPTGDVPANTLPKPMEMTHFGEPAVSPILPSSVSIAELASRWLTRPLAALPVGSTIVSAAAIVGARALANAWMAAAESGKSPMPLLETVAPLTTSLTCTKDGTAEKLSHGVACSCNAPDRACSDRWSLSFADPAVTPAATDACAASDAGPRASPITNQQTGTRTIS